MLNNTPTLTPREKEIAFLVGQGKANKQIAVELGITEQTVKNHITDMLKKVNVSNRIGLVVALIGHHRLRVTELLRDN